MRTLTAPDSELQRLYEDEHLTLREIGECFNVSKQAVHYRFKAVGVEFRSTWKQQP